MSQPYQKPSNLIGNAANGLAQRISLKQGAEEKSDLMYEIRAETAKRLTEKHQAVATNLVGIFKLFTTELQGVGFTREESIQIASDLIMSDFVGQQLTTV